MKKKSYKAEEQGHYGAKMTVMQPTVENASSQNVASLENLCRNDNPVKYRDCPDYNTEYCRQRCEFGAKETVVSNVDLDYSRKDGK